MFNLYTFLSYGCGKRGIDRDTVETERHFTSFVMSNDKHVDTQRMALSRRDRPEEVIYIYIYT